MGNKKVLIITGANTAKEINPHGDLCPIVPAPSFNHESIKIREKLWLKREKWKNAESSLKEYRITNINNSSGNDIVYDKGNKHFITSISSKVECEVNEETLEAIIL